MTLREKFAVPAATEGAVVYGAPHETADGSTIITVAGPGLIRPGPRPVGIFVIREGEVTWKPANDESRIALVAVLTGLLATVFTTLAVLRRPPWPELSFHKTEHI
ncbi:hypothetical protein [Nocardia mexicana]|uniref:Sporulation protein YtfJ n=1 Tax=Nocardia mexicana TaxID=279262 RepID=A0A370GEB8_9NOCA|nr:hypothetical protein [Nocardia mexicana]RDI42132.1 hypothetical protein DFR68_12824 [Nocardia mexicana]